MAIPRRGRAGHELQAALAVLALVVPLVAFVVTLTSAEHSPRAAEVAATLERAPLVFEANDGQLPNNVQFLARAPGLQAMLTGDGLWVSPTGADGALVGVTLAGARSDVQAVGLRPTSTKVHRLVGEDPTGWRTDLRTYDSVSYQGVYPGIDLVFYGRGRQVEHDFIVSPGADPSVIRLAVTGATGRIDTNGDLVLPAANGSGEVRLLAPTLYQDIDGRRRPVSGRYIADAEGRFGFSVGSYDRRHPLVIDPVVVSASYLGGTSTDTAYGVTTDAEGNMVVTGYTESSDFPTVSPAQTALAQAEGTRTDVFVTKVKADGGTVLWSTYLGGRGRDAAFAAAVGRDGGVYVTGYSESADFPTTRPLQGSNAGGASDVFVAKLNPAGSALEYSTYLGGKGADSGTGIAVDANGAAVVVGSTGSSDFPVARAFQGSLSKADDVDAFVAKLEPSGSGLSFSSYLGGSADDHALDVAVDAEGNVYLAGDTRSPNFPTVRPVQATPGGQAGQGAGTFADAFVSKVRADGSGLVYSTYLGGADSDKGTGVAVDEQGHAYVVGNTGSSNFPSVNAAQPRKDGDFDAFAAKLKPDGASLAYSTYLGGSGSDGAEGVAVDRRGHAHVTGATASANFPTVRAFQAAKGGGFVDAFVSRVNASGGALVSSSYLGGRDDDQAAGIAVDRDGNAVVAGYTNSADFPIAKPFQPGKGGGVGDAFVSKVRDDTAAEGTRSTPASARREQRVRLLVTITGGLFIAAVLQTVWLRRRPEPRRPEPRPQPAGAGAGPGGPGAPGPPPLPQRERIQTGGGDGRSGVRVLDDRRLEELLSGAGGESEERDPWRPEELARPRLRRVEPPPVDTGPSRMVAPDLWASDAPVADASAAMGRGRGNGNRGWEPPADLLGLVEEEQPPTTAAPEWPVEEPEQPVADELAEELSGPDYWPTAPPAGDGAPMPEEGEQLDPLDVWGPLADPADPDRWAEEWQLEQVMEATALQSAAVTQPEPAPEPPPPPAPEPAPEPAPARAYAHRPHGEPDQEATPAEMSAAFADVVKSALGLSQSVPSVEEFAPAPPYATEAEPEWVPLAPSGPPQEPEEPAPAEAGSQEISISQLLDEELPIPEPEPGAVQDAQSDRVWMEGILDESFEPLGEAPVGPPPDPSGLAPPAEPPEAAEAEPAPEELQAQNEEDLPPPPPRLLENIFEPDPNDPLVRATRHGRRGS